MDEHGWRHGRQDDGWVGGGEGEEWVGRQGRRGVGSCCDVGAFNRSPSGASSSSSCSGSSHRRRRRVFEVWFGL